MSEVERKRPQPWHNDALIAAAFQLLGGEESVIAGPLYVCAQGAGGVLVALDYGPEGLVPVFSMELDYWRGRCAYKVTCRRNGLWMDRLVDMSRNCHPNTPQVRKDLAFEDIDDGFLFVEKAQFPSGAVPFSVGPPPAAGLSLTQPPSDPSFDPHSAGQIVDDGEEG